MVSKALEDVIYERRRQKRYEGFDNIHDDKYLNDQLTKAAVCCALPESLRNLGLWPFHISWWKPSNRRRDLIKAAALIIAEIDRMDRLDIK